MGVKQDLVNKREELEAKRSKLKGIFDKAGKEIDLTKVDELEGETADKVKKIREMSKELDDLQDEVEGLKALVEAEEKSARVPEIEHPKPVRGRAEKSFGELFVESTAFKDFKGGTGPSSFIDIGLKDLGLKTLFETSAGWAPQDIRTGRVVEYATRPIQVIDIIPMGNTNQSAVVYMEETTFTNNAAETSEGNQYGEAALELTEKTANVRKIAVFIPVTDEQLEDIPQVQGYLNNRLRFMLRQRLDLQILEGDGSAPNLEGIRQNGSIQSQAKGTDPVPDAFYKAMTKVRVTGQAIPNVIVIHPEDWEPVRLMRTSDGIYIWGSPSESGPDRLWGLPAVLAQAITKTNGLVGDFANFVELTERRGIEVQISNSHSDYFIKGKQAIRADMRVALPIYRPEAFCEVTGL